MDALNGVPASHSRGAPMLSITSTSAAAATVAQRCDGPRWCGCGGDVWASAATCASTARQAGVSDMSGARATDTTWPRRCSVASTSTGPSSSAAHITTTVSVSAKSARRRSRSCSCSKDGWHEMMGMASAAVLHGMRRRTSVRMTYSGLGARCEASSK